MDLTVEHWQCLWSVVIYCNTFIIICNNMSILLQNLDDSDIAHCQYCDIVEILPNPNKWYHGNGTWKYIVR